jgi:hypothetical protein
MHHLRVALRFGIKVLAQVWRLRFGDGVDSPSLEGHAAVENKVIREIDDPETT